MNKKTTSGLKIITINRKASFNYFFKDIIEAGIVLKGSEIKSVRSGKVNIAESYAVEKKGEIPKAETPKVEAKKEPLQAEVKVNKEKASKVETKTKTEKKLKNTPEKK